MRIAIVAATSLAAALAAHSSGTTFAAQNDKAAETLAAARKAIGARQLDALKTFSLAGTLQRNVGTMQLNSDVELLLDLPDKYFRQDISTGPVSATMTMGFNGDKPIRRSDGPMGGGGLVIRMGGGGGAFTSGPEAEKPSPEQQEKINQGMLRSMRHEVSRLMLGWFATTHPAVHAEYTFAGEAESPDGKAYVIDAKNGDGFAARLFIDQQSNLPLMLTYQGPQPRVITSGGPRTPNATGAQHGADHTRQLSPEEQRAARESAQKQLQELQRQPPTMVEYTLYFDDWREIDGIKFPHRMRRASAGATTEEWVITKVKVNPKIDAKKFAIES